MKIETFFARSGRRTPKKLKAIITNKETMCIERSYSAVFGVLHSSITSSDDVDVTVMSVIIFVRRKFFFSKLHYETRQKNGRIGKKNSKHHHFHEYTLDIMFKSNSNAKPKIILKVEKKINLKIANELIQLEYMT